MHRQFTSKEKEKLEAATTMAQLAEVALPILYAMYRMYQKTHRGVVMVSGPISTGGAGNITANLMRFAEAIRVLRQKDFVVFNQLPFEAHMVRIYNRNPPPPGQYATAILTDFYEALIASGYLGEMWFLPDWISSTGARWERAACVHYFVPVIEFPEQWLPATPRVISPVYNRLFLVA